MVARLSHQQRDLLSLRFGAGLSYAEMGSLLNKNESAVKMAVHRLIQRLQKDWDKTNE
jgi:RNA polymerase sigma factor (sigma-70 family)